MEYNIEELMAVQGPAGISSESALVEDIEKALEELGTAKENADAAKAELDRLIKDKLHDGADPFVAMLDAMLFVVPQLMKYKEEKLVEKTANYDYVSTLNAYMAETQKNFSRSGDASEPWSASNKYGPYKVGNTTGLSSGRAYESNLKTLKGDDLYRGLPGDVQDVMYGSIEETLGLKGSAPKSKEWYSGAKTEYNLSESLWQGLNSPQWRMKDGSTHEYSNDLYSVTSGQGEDPYEKFNFFREGQTEASYVTGQLNLVLDDAVTQNAVMESTLNGYAKRVESEFKFEMENFNTIVTLNGLMLQDQLNLNNTHITRLRAK